MKNKTLILICTFIAVISLASCGAVEENIDVALSNITTPETEQSESETAEEQTEKQTEQLKEEQTEMETEAIKTENTTVAETEITEITEEVKSVEETEAVPVSEKVYANAYLEICKSLEEENGGNLTYALVDIDGDDIPELSAGYLGYWVSLYTYADGKVYNIMDHYGYGASGNVGYDYIPGQNYLHNSNSDFAGLVRYETYMKVNDNHEMETIASIKCVHFEDANGNGNPDEGESDKYLEEPKCYIDDAEITFDEAQAYNKGTFKEVAGTMTYEEITEALK